MRALFVDECHLMSGDLEGYVWGRRNQRVEVPIVMAVLCRLYHTDVPEGPIYRIGSILARKEISEPVQSIGAD